MIRYSLSCAAVRHPGVGVGVVGAGLVENRQRLAVARPLHRDAGRGEQRRGDQSCCQAPHSLLLTPGVVLAPDRSRGTQAASGRRFLTACFCCRSGTTESIYGRTGALDCRPLHRHARATSLLGRGEVWWERPWEPLYCRAMARLGRVRGLTLMTARDEAHGDGNALTSGRPGASERAISCLSHLPHPRCRGARLHSVRLTHVVPR